MSHKIMLTLLAGTALVLGAAAPAAAQPQQTPRVVSGFYDSYGRIQNSDNTLPKNDRFVKIEALSLGGLRITAFNGNGQVTGTQFLVRKCEVRYDARIVSFFQNFETVPAKGDPEKVTFVFRINDPQGDYDVYFSRPGFPTTSEVLKRR